VLAMRRGHAYVIAKLSNITCNLHVKRAWRIIHAASQGLYMYMYIIHV